jgi:hypothetical protein
MYNKHTEVHLLDVVILKLKDMFTWAVLSRQYLHFWEIVHFGVYVTIFF